MIRYWKHSKEEVESGVVRSNPAITLSRPCDCGCDDRDGSPGVGYLIITSGDGEGITIHFENERDYRVVYNALEHFEHMVEK